MKTPANRKRTTLRHTPDQEERFAHLMHSLVLAFQKIRDKAESDNATLRAEWRQARGIAVWTEERLGSVEARLTRLETAAGLPPAPATETLKAVLANYGPSLEALGVRPLPGSAPGDAR